MGYVDIFNEVAVHGVIREMRITEHYEPKLGLCVVIEHSDGSCIRYSGKNFKQALNQAITNMDNNVKQQVQRYKELSKND